jgi:tRNA(Ile)-lysidine synthase TilS/MesJ/rhodanese-related sulfurtransferase
MYRKTFDEMKNDTRDKVIIDLRKEEDFSRETYPGAVNIYWENIDENVAYNDTNRPIYLMCYTGEKSDEIADELKERGIEAYSLEGGYRAYLRIKLAELVAGNAAEQQRNDQAELSYGASDARYSGGMRQPGADDTDGRQLDDTPGQPGGKKKKSLTRSAQIERSIVKKFRKEIWRKFTKAINEYELIQDGDKIAVCISGGKDSMLMAKLFQELKRHGKNNFEVVFLVMNPGYNEENYTRIVENAKLLEVPITVFKSEIFDSVVEEENPCYLCARMRRGHLYAKAKELGCNKIALGHHFDDVIETIVMGMLYGAQIQTMMPKLHSTNFPGMELIRPLYLVRESDIIHWMNYNDLHFIQCACRFTENCASCGGTGKGSMRADVKALIKVLAKTNPYIEKNIFRSVENVNLNTIIAYKSDGVKHHFLDTYDD